MGACQSGVFCAYSDIAPNFSTELNSIGNTCGSVAGIIGPLIIAACSDAFEGVWAWRMYFFITNFFIIISLISWSIYQTSSVVPELNTPIPRHK